MFVSHLETLGMVQRLEHQAHLSEGVQVRRAAEVAQAPSISPSRPVKIRFKLGFALVRIGRRLQDAVPDDVGGSSLIGTGTLP